MALIPPPLTEHAVIAAVSPAGPVDEGEVRRGGAVLEQEGWHVRLGPNALKRDAYLAGTDDERVDDLHWAFTDDAVDAVLCTRGGYGTLRLLDRLDWAAIADHPKPFIGFSDISALQYALWRETGLVSWSGLQLCRGLPDAHPFSKRQWLGALRGDIWERPLPMPGGEAMQTITPGIASGPLVGGNLAVMAALCGTPWSPDFSGSVVLLEEIDEPAYRVDRMLTQLLLSGAFEGAAGIVLGRFTQHLRDRDPVDHGVRAAQVLTSALPGVPLVLGAPYGHVGPTWTVPLGAEAHLDAGRPALTLHRPRS